MVRGLKGLVQIDGLLLCLHLDLVLWSILEVVLVVIVDHVIGRSLLFITFEILIQVGVIHVYVVGTQRLFENVFLFWGWLEERISLPLVLRQLIAQMLHLGSWHLWLLDF